MDDNYYQRSQRLARSSSPFPTPTRLSSLYRKYVLLGVPPTPQRLLLLLTRFQKQLQARPRTCAVLFLCVFSVHNALCPISQLEAPSDLNIAAAILLWTTYALVTVSFWYTANIIVPVWISLAFREILEYASLSPWLTVPLLAAWGLSVLAWIRAGSVRAFANGEWVNAAEKRDAREQTSRLLQLQEESCRKFSAQMLAWLFSTPEVNKRGKTKMMLREEGEEVAEGVDVSLWTEGQLLILRPAPSVETRLKLWPSFDKFVDSAKESVRGLHEDMGVLRKSMSWNVELRPELERLYMLIDITIEMWEGLYVELMHPEGKDETKRPEVGDRLPMRILNAVKWFRAVEKNGKNVIVVEFGPPPPPSARE
ncbi:hypothetical protein FN846DRAFT_908041 [Sphaerosporella brunnea]|uniref:Uncharacterized protein n=1 Tax=Sphaerosporella brunnea TaxID=1250544 RepID=A0A5J5EUM4_9PEZI|nr:hypothetical protein FN846DRAFT_908041 [Sphaerosporella brunnea]